MSLSNDDLRLRAERRVEAREGFRIHLIVFVLINLMLWAFWALSGADMHNPWPLYATLGWGVAVVAHWYVVMGRSDESREAEVQREIQRLRRGGGTA